MTTGTSMPDEPVAELVGDKRVFGDEDEDVIFVSSTLVDLVVNDGDSDSALAIIPDSDSPTTIPDSPIVLLIETPSMEHSDGPIDQNDQHHCLDIGVTGEDVGFVEHTQPNSTYNVGQSVESPEQSWLHDPAAEFWRLGLTKIKEVSTMFQCVEFYIKTFLIARLLEQKCTK